VDINIVLEIHIVKIVGWKMTTVKEIIESLDTWHSDKVRGNKVYFADAVICALNKFDSQSD